MLASMKEGNVVQYCTCTRQIAWALLPTVLFVSMACPLWAASEKPDRVDLTWLSVTNWLFEVGSTRILMDGYITRIPEAAFSGVGFATATPMKPDEPAIRRVRDALGESGKIDFILTGHSHFDHSFDTATWAKLTGARIIGARSTCLQALAQGVPELQCTAVEGGEVLALGDHTTVRVVRWNHSGDVSTPMGRVLYSPVELIKSPTLTSGTGGLRGGTLQDFPNGGGARAYLFTVQTAKGLVSWLYSNTGNADTFQKAAAVDEQFFKAQGFSLDNLTFVPPRAASQDNLRAAMQAATLERVALWIGYSDRRLMEAVGKVLRPHVHIPHHWDGLFTSFFAGVPFAYASVAGTQETAEECKKQTISLLAPQQYMDKYQLTAQSVTPIANDAIKQKLALPKPPAAPSAAERARIMAHND
jgi:hypothetical protein